MTRIGFYILLFLCMVSCIFTSCIKKDTSPLSYTSFITVFNNTEKPITVTTSFPKTLSRVQLDSVYTYNISSFNCCNVFEDSLLAYSKESFVSSLVSVFDNPTITISYKDSVCLSEIISPNLFEEKIEELRAPFQKRPYVLSHFYINVSD